MIKTFLKSLLILSTISTQIKDLCEDVQTYNSSKIKNNAEIQTDYPTLKEAINSGDIVGEGSFGKVYKINFRKTESDPFKKIAIKKIQTFQIEKNKKNYKQNLEDEIKIMKLLNTNENKIFVKFHSCKYEKNRSYDESTAQRIISQNEKIQDESKKLKYAQKQYIIYIFQEALKTDLLTNFDNFRGHLTNYEKQDLYVKLFKNLKILHEDFGISHNDIKPENIMMNSNFGILHFRLKFIDFGLSKKLGEKFCGGTLEFMHPEFFRLKNDTVLKKGFDLYSLALSVFMLEMDNPEHFELPDFCYSENFRELNCLEILHLKILQDFQIDKREVFYVKENEIVPKGSQGYFYKLKNLDVCETLACVLIHCLREREEQIPMIDRVIERLEYLLNILRKKKDILFI